MASSSEESFAWTNASNDSSDNDDMAVSNHNLTQSGEESESGNVYKKQLQKRLFSGSGDEASEKVIHQQKKRKLSQQESDSDSFQRHKKKRVKAELDTTADILNKKKHSLVKSNNQGSENDPYDETFLESKVKSEQSFVVPTSIKAKKNKKKSVSGGNEISINGDTEQLEQQSLSAKELSTSQICFEEYSAPDSGLKEQKDGNKEHSMKTKNIKKKSKTKSNSLVINDVEVEDVQSGGENSIQTDETVATKRHLSILEDELFDSQNHVPHDISANRKSIKKQVTTMNNDASHYHNSVDTESLFTKRKSRMSERLQFEDDDSDVQAKNNVTSSSIKSNNAGKKLMSFIEDSSISLRPSQMNLPNSVILSNEDDVWLVSCPKDVQLEAFQDKKWVLDNKCKIKLDGQTYEGDIDNMDTNMTILSSAQNRAIVRNIKVSGCIRLRRRLPKVYMQDHNIIVNKQTNFIPLPDTKCRHPLFGLNYKKAIKVPSRVAERLRASRAPAPDPAPTSVKRKTKKEKAAYSEPEALKAEPASDECTRDINTTKKKKKRKHSNAVHDEGEPCFKRTKRDITSAEVWESAQAIEENLFNF